MIFNSYTKRDTQILKGFAILCIVFHNYFHWLSPSPGENEFIFSRFYVDNFFKLLCEQPSECINILFSYLGHYGVQIFIFISGFGLTASMLKKTRKWENFIVNRLKKIYPLLLIGILVCFIGRILMGEKGFSSFEWKEIGYKLLFINTLIPGEGTSINGPWWFFALIFQLYILFPLLFKLVRKYDIKAFAIVCLVAYCAIFLYRGIFTLYKGEIIMMSALGHLPEFTLGILLAMPKERKINIMFLIAAIVLFICGNFCQWIYPFTFLSITVICVFAYQWLQKLPTRKIGNLFSYFGQLSMALFVIHAIFRPPFLKLYETAGGHLLSALFFFLTVWAIAIPVKTLYQWIVSKLDKIVIKENKLTHLFGSITQILIAIGAIYVISYYIHLNVKDFRNDMLENVEITQTGNIQADNMFYNILTTTLQSNHTAMQLSGTFVLTDTSGNENMPCLVLDIAHVTWTKIPIEKKTDENGNIICSFSFDYYRPFPNHIKGKKLKLYFWNPNKGLIRFKDMNVTIKN